MYEHPGSNWIGISMLRFTKNIGNSYDSYEVSIKSQVFATTTFFFFFAVNPVMILLPKHFLWHGLYTQY